MYNFVVEISAEATVTVVVVVEFPCDVDASVVGIADEVTLTDAIVVISFSDDQCPPPTLS